MRNPSNSTATTVTSNGLKSLTRSTPEDATKTPLEREPSSDWTAGGQSTTTEQPQDEEESKNGGEASRYGTAAGSSAFGDDVNTVHTSVKPVSTGQQTKPDTLRGYRRAEPGEKIPDNAPTFCGQIMVPR